MADIKKYNVFNINPALRNSKYAFLFPFSIYKIFALDVSRHCIEIKKRVC